MVENSDFMLLATEIWLAAGAQYLSHITLGETLQLECFLL